MTHELRVGSAIVIPEPSNISAPNHRIPLWEQETHIERRNKHEIEIDSAGLQRG